MPSLADYRKHYRADARFIRDPEDLPPARFATEQRRLEVALRQLRLERGVRLLDIGCGSGWLANECSRHGASVTATDIAPSGVAAARRRFPEVEYAAADIYDMPMAAASFDAVVLSEVLEHVERVADALVEVRRLLVPGGRLLVTVPFRETIVEHLCIHCNRPTPANAHLHRFDTGSLTSALQDGGFEVARFAYTNNKLLELAGFPAMSRRWPHWAWRGCDRMLTCLIGRPAFVLAVAVRAHG